MSENSNIQDLKHKNAIIITHKNLPLACPMQNLTLWNAHPRVYLPIEKTGEATCPYCGKHYILEGLEQEQPRDLPHE